MNRWATVIRPLRGLQADFASLSSATLQLNYVLEYNLQEAQRRGELTQESTAAPILFVNVLDTFV